MKSYILVVVNRHVDGALVKAYQEIERGAVLRHTDLEGNTISVEASDVVPLDKAPERPAWAPSINDEPKAAASAKTIAADVWARMTQEERASGAAALALALFGTTPSDADAFFTSKD
jgi:hypothetical protein